MISYLEGKIILKNDKFIVVNVNGIGFKVFLASSRIEKLSKKEVSLFCCLRFRKDFWDLYGFLSQEEMNLFDFLMTVPGVGPKAALEISAIGSLDNLKKAIKEDNQKIMENVFKIGRKKAQAVIFEISREIKEVKKNEDEIVKPLIKLGFSRKEIKEALSVIPEKGTVELRIKEALKVLGK